MRSRGGLPTGANPFAVAVLAAMCAAGIANAGKTGVAPGPTTITAEERAIRADPAAGVEHAVILVEETERDEDLGEDMQTAYHLRAKVLSNEGRSLANIELPWLDRGARLTEWWGRTILDDGRVLELTKESLEHQTAVEVRGSELRSVKAVLPGVAPGCVIDYGYVIREKGYFPYDRLPVQRRWPIRSFRLRWRPTRFLPGAYRMNRLADLDLRASLEDGALLIVGRDLPPVKEEPLMPPNHLVRASVVLYYTPPGLDIDEFWAEMSDMLENDWVKPATRKKKLVREAMEAMRLPAGGPAEERLRSAYEWINANIKRTDVSMFEDVESAREDEKRSQNLLLDLLDRREGSPLALQVLFIAVARELGAEAFLVVGADRTERLFDPGLRSLRQVDATFVALPSGGARDVVVVDPGSGLSYGTVPWWNAGTKALMLGGAKAREIELPSTTARDNVARTIAEVEFTDDNSLIVSRWTESSAGQVGLSERRHLRRLSPGEREEWLALRCGAGPDVEVLEAVAEGLEDLAAELRFRCETERTDVDLEGIGVYKFSWNGPWVTSPPDLPEGPRTHPVFFDFPREDATRVTIRTPEGFAPAEPPEPRRLESPYGRYSLDFRRTEEGFEIDRDFALYPLLLPPAEYATLHEFIDAVKRSDRTVIEFRRAAE